MGFAGYITVCVQLYCVSCHCLTLHVSAYMAIFKCVRYFYFHISEGIFFAGFFAFFSRGHTLHVSICVFPVLFFFVNFVVSCVCVCLLALSLLFVLYLLLSLRAEGLQRRLNKVQNIWMRTVNVLSQLHNNVQYNFITEYV
jgi:hypothetical protein